LELDVAINPVNPTGLHTNTGRTGKLDIHLTGNLGSAYRVTRVVTHMKAASNGIRRIYLASDLFGTHATNAGRRADQIGQLVSNSFSLVAHCNPDERILVDTSQFTFHPPEGKNAFTVHFWVDEGLTLTQVESVSIFAERV
jgi:hypothetical protein